MKKTECMHFYEPEILMHIYIYIKIHNHLVNQILNVIENYK